MTKMRYFYYLTLALLTATFSQRPY